MGLTGGQYEEFCLALVDAFPTASALEQMLRFRLSKNLSRYALGNNLFDVAFKLVAAAEAEGWTLALIAGARDANPGNAKLLALAAQFGLAPRVPAGFDLERVIREAHAFVDVEIWLSRLGEIAGQVCRVEVALNDGHIVFGTGFLVGPDLVLTNYHVMEDVIMGEARRSAGAWAKPQDVTLRFDYRRSADGTFVRPGCEYKLAHDWLLDFGSMSPVDHEREPKLRLPESDELDYALLRVAGMPGDGTIGPGPSRESPRRGWICLPDDGCALVSGAPLLIVQHPQSEPLKLDVNTIIDTNRNATRVRYRTNTEPGSSGSPCFDVNWNAVAMHHSGDPNFDRGHEPEYNEGIPLDSIVRLLKHRGVLPLA